jgi:hypothetical protein
MFDRRGHWIFNIAAHNQVRGKPVAIYDYDLAMTRVKVSLCQCRSPFLRTSPHPPRSLPSPLSPPPSSHPPATPPSLPVSVDHLALSPAAPQTTSGQRRERVRGHAQGLPAVSAAALLDSASVIAPVSSVSNWLDEALARELRSSSMSNSFDFSVKFDFCPLFQNL